MPKKSALKRVSDVEHLRDAWKAIKKRNQRSKGLDDVTIYQFKIGLEQNLNQISSELQSKSYAFNKLRPHAIEKPGSANKRPLQIAAVRDRVVMKAIANIISPAFEQFNLPCSFAYVKGGGVGAAVRRIHEFINMGYGTYIEADIINFFGRVDKELLWHRFSKHVRYKSLLPLIRQCFDLELGDIENLKTEDQKLFLGADSGIPQGGCLSPMLANFYLYDFDRKMLDSGFHLVRYADDFVIMCESKERAEQAYTLCNRTLQDLKLEIHPLGSDKTRIGNFSKEGLGFLGLHLQGKQAIPAKKSRERFELKIRAILKAHSGVNLSDTLQKLKNTIHSWGRYYRSMDVTEIFLALDKFIELSVQAYLKDLDIILKGRNRRKQLKFLGIPSLSRMVDHSKDDSKSKPPALPPLKEVSEKSAAGLAAPTAEDLSA